MRVLVTGHLGYIGTVLTRMLVSQGFEVVGIDSDLFRQCTFCKGMIDVPTVCKDIRDVQLEDVRGFDAVLHLAALANDALGDLDPETTLAVNYRATLQLAELAREAGARRFIFSSSCSNYGAGGEEVLTEESPFRPVTVYGRSKVLAEQGLSELATDGFSPVLLRNATVYGVSPRLRFDLVLNNLVAWGFTTGEVRLKSDGTPWRPVVHVEDVCRAFIAVLNAPRDLVHNEAFNVGRTGENFQIRDLARIAAETVSGCSVGFAEGASPDARCYRVNCDKIVRALEFQPEWDARRGAEELHAAYRTEGLDLDEFEGPKYKRIAHLRSLIESGVVGDDLRRAEPTRGRASGTGATARDEKG
ncbi:MAG: NAD-dependent epimerase/dehydratase family protein [Planctomycetota bacterium]|jgi:nucleoside-diphosphate-sugar epimerase